MSKPLVYIVIYSLYHHVYKLSLSVKEGLESKGIDVKLFQVQETLSDEILSKMQAPSKPDLPIITVDKLSEPDGILFGLPTRFGTMPAQMKALLDASGALWAKGALAGKFAGTFFSTASQHGGQETTALTAVTYFAHHGMMYVPFGYANAAMGSVEEVIGGSAYGCGTISDGDGSRQPSHTELSIAENQGANFGEIVYTFVKGRDSNTAGTYQNSSNSNGSTNPPVASSVDTNHGAATDPNVATSHTGSNVGAGVAGAGVAGAGAAAAVSSINKRSSTSGDNTLRSATENNEIASVGNSNTPATNSVPTNSATEANTGAGVDNNATGTNMNPSDIKPAPNTTSDTPSGNPATGITPSAGTPATNVIDAKADKVNSTNDATGTNVSNNTTDTNANNNSTTGTNNLGDAAKTGAAGAAVGAAAGATGATAGATNAATTAAGKSTGVTSNAVKESLVKGKGKDKTKKKRWFCC